jgi:hypothetical protein
MKMNKAVGPQVEGVQEALEVLDLGVERQAAAPPGLGDLGGDLGEPRERILPLRSRDLAIKKAVSQVLSRFLPQAVSARLFRLGKML